VNFLYFSNYYNNLTESVQGLKTHKIRLNSLPQKIKSHESTKGVILHTEITNIGGIQIMQNTLILVGITLVIIMGITMTTFMFRINRYIRDMNKTLAHQYNLIVKIQSVLKNKSATNAVAENAEMIYQDLLQNLIPIMAAIDVMPRNTSEHPLWRALGGIMDEYAKNPFALEKLRRCIKLDSEIARSIDNYMRRADAFLVHLNSTEPDGILSATFTDGLLGQSLTFFAQAKQLATQEH